MKKKTVLKRLRNNKGVALAAVIMVLLVVSVFSIMVIYVSSSDVRLNMIDERNSENYYIAWSAANVVADELKKAAEENKDKFNELLSTNADNKFLPKTNETFIHNVEFALYSTKYNAQVAIKKTKQKTSGNIVENYFYIVGNYNDAKAYISMRIDVEKAPPKASAGSGFVVQNGGWYNDVYGDGLGSHITKGESNYTSKPSQKNGVTVVGAVHADGALYNSSDVTFTWPTDDNQIPYTNDAGHTIYLKLPENYREPAFNVQPSAILNDSDFGQVLNAIRYWNREGYTSEKIMMLLTEDNTSARYFTSDECKAAGINEMGFDNGSPIVSLLQNHPKIVEDIINEEKDREAASKKGMSLEQYRAASMQEDIEISNKTGLTDEEKANFHRDYPVSLGIPRLDVEIPKNSSRLNSVSPGDYKATETYTFDRKDANGITETVKGITVYVNLLRHSTTLTHDCKTSNCSVVHPCENYYNPNSYGQWSYTRDVEHFEKIVQTILDDPDPKADKDIKDYDEVTIVFTGEYVYNAADNKWYSFNGKTYNWGGADYFATNTSENPKAVDIAFQIKQEGTVTVPSGKNLILAFDQVGGDFRWEGTNGSLYKNADTNPNDFASVSFVINQIKDSAPEGEGAYKSAPVVEDYMNSISKASNARFNFRMFSENGKTNINCPIHIFAPDGSVISPGDKTMTSVFYGSIYANHVGINNLTLSYVPSEKNQLVNESGTENKPFKAKEIKMNWVRGGEYNVDFEDE
ncbi:MAG: hypothetical protein LBS21_13995 [Clostridiales bacterium]|jgi:hypothetical protein|nr:hypothetical protein [Clostridiales bacterium]